MKKTYQKPKIMFEHLELDSAINTCTFMPVTNCQDVTPNDGTKDIPYNVVSSIDGSIETMIKQQKSVTMFHGLVAVHRHRFHKNAEARGCFSTQSILSLACI